MRILTLLKRVPDSNAPIKVLADGSGIDTTGLKQVIDPFDEFGVEQGIRLKEQRKDVEEVVAMGAGVDSTVEALRTALAMGVDRAIHLSGDAFETKDEHFLARAIVAAIKKDAKGYDLILCGKHNIDLDSGQIGPAVAELLDIPHVGAVTKLEMAADGKSFKANRRIEGAEEVVECSLPALITCEKGLVEPRYPSLPNLMKAKKKPVDTIAAADVQAENSGLKFLSLSPPPPRPACRMLEGEPEQMAKDLVKLLREEAKVI